jgi:hypothetical protein
MEIAGKAGQPHGSQYVTIGNVADNNQVAVAKRGYLKNFIPSEGLVDAQPDRGVLPPPSEGAVHPNQRCGSSAQH